MATPAALAGSPSGVVSLADAAALAHVPLGTKARQLSRLLAAGFPVPAGFVVTPPAFREPASLAEAVAAHYHRLGPDNPPVAVRSSGALEDLAGASFAGQYETVLGVRGLDQVLAAIDRCRASAAAPHIAGYTAHHGRAAPSRLATQEPGDIRDHMSVLVQRLVPADAAGVAFGIDPVTGDASCCVINAAWGLGESVVSGTVTPDAHIVEWQSLKTTTHLGDKHEKVVALATGGVATVATTAAERRAPALCAEQVLQVVDLLARLQEWCGTPLDIEFAFTANQLHLLQARPITALGADLAE